tara:strand:- start:470 stop:766 length:297 start_codon:yes stop_codon:yes gene_type:complete
MKSSNTNYLWEAFIMAPFVQKENQRENETNTYIEFVKYLGNEMCNDEIDKKYKEFCKRERKNFLQRKNRARKILLTHFIIGMYKNNKLKKMNSEQEQE